MPSSLQLEIRTELAKYLASELTLRAFEDWFVPASWNVHQTGNAGDADLVYTIELHLSEFSRGHWTENELRALLLPLVTDYRVPAGDDVTGSMTPEVTKVPVILRQGLIAGISAAGASA